MRAILLQVGEKKRQILYGLAFSHGSFALMGGKYRDWKGYFCRGIAGRVKSEGMGWDFIPGPMPGQMNPDAIYYETGDRSGVLCERFYAVPHTRPCSNPWEE
jgi:hypothetical protein